MSDIKSITTALLDFRNERDWEQFHNPKDSRNFEIELNPKNKLCVKSFFSFILLIFFQITYSQQFSFNQLIDMTDDYKVFEIKMIKELNQAVEKSKRTGYSYSTLNGTIGSSENMPTNDSRYEPIYKFDDGKIYKESEIEEKNLDNDFVIRNKLRTEGKLLNEEEIKGFDFVRSKIISLIKSELIKIGFAENYNTDENVASTWYSWEGKSYKKILIQSSYFSPNYKKLEIEFARDSDFSKILNQIVSVCKYIDTKEEYGSFISNYKYGIHSITSERRDIGHGGIITIKVEQKLK